MSDPQREARMSKAEWIARQTISPEPCGYCGEPAMAFFSFNPEAVPDICPACFVTAEGFAQQDALAAARGNDLLAEIDAMTQERDHAIQESLTITHHLEARVQQLEGALREIADRSPQGPPDPCNWFRAVARTALVPPRRTPNG